MTPPEGSQTQRGRSRGPRSSSAPKTPRAPVEELNPIDTPPDIETFTHWDLGAELQGAIAEMGITVPTPIQRLAIGPVLEGRDVIAKAETGTGKTLAFGAPIVAKLDPSRASVLALALCPTRELAQQVAGVLRTLGAARGLKVALLVGGDPMQPQIKELQKGAQIVVGTPGRVIDLYKQKFLSFPWTEYVVLDEADEMLEIGFLDDVEKILDYTPPERQTLLFSATFPPALLSLARKHTREPVELATAKGVATVDRIQQVAIEVAEEDRARALRAMIQKSSPDELLLVFCERRTEVDRLMRSLDRLPEQVKALHGGYDQASRFRVMSAFRSGEVRALVATDVASRGLDVSGVTHVINFSVPRDVSGYTHRIGRTGRAGRSGKAITFLCPPQVRRWRELEERMTWTVPHVSPDEVLALFGGEDAPEPARPARAERQSGGSRERGSEGTRERRPRRDSAEPAERVERAARPERAERPERAARPERKERAQRTERPARAERPARTVEAEAAVPPSRPRRSRHDDAGEAAPTSRSAEVRAGDERPRRKVRDRRDGVDGSEAVDRRDPELRDTARAPLQSRDARAESRRDASHRASETRASETRASETQASETRASDTRASETRAADTRPARSPSSGGVRGSQGSDQRPIRRGGEPVGDRSPQRASPKPEERPLREREPRSARAPRAEEERAQPERTERRERAQTEARGERPSNSDRPRRSERSVDPVTTERPQRAERSARPERAERPERAARPERSERPERAERPARAERTAANAPVTTSREAREDRPARTPRTDGAPTPNGASRGREPRRSETPTDRAPREERGSTRKPKRDAAAPENGGFGLGIDDGQRAEKQPAPRRRSEPAAEPTRRAAPNPEQPTARADESGFGAGLL